MDCLIRPATSDDLPQMNAIYNEALLNTTCHYFSEPKTEAERLKWFSEHGKLHPVFVADYNGMIIGWASLTRWSPYYAFELSVEDSVYIHKDYQNKGLGFKLLQKVLVEGEKAGVKTVISRILDGNPSSIRIHERLGFEHTGVMKEIGKKFGKFIDLYMMQKMFY